LHGLDEGGVANLEVVEPDLFAAREQAHRERERVEHEIASRVLEPTEAVLGDPLGALDDGAALLFVGREGSFDASPRRCPDAPTARLGDDGVSQRDGVLHRELGAGANREVCGVRGVAEQNDVLVAPARVLHVEELNPRGAVRQ
jgi:hypothetical protein